MRARVEIEANLMAILLDNSYVAAKGNLTMQQYRVIDISHRLSSYDIRVSAWHSSKGIRMPFACWSSKNLCFGIRRTISRSTTDMRISSVLHL